MASFFNLGSRFGRQPKDPSKPNTSGQTSPNDTQPSPTFGLQAPPSIPQLPRSSSFSASMSSETSANSELPPPNPPMPNTRVPFFFREENTTLVVKGNFLTLAAKPEHVEKGEWLAHQVVEQYRLLEGMIKVIQEIDTKTGMRICNPTTCPTMSASSYVYTWLDKNRNPTRIPAAEYISLVQRWIMGKISDPKLFPTDTSFSQPQANTYVSGQTNTSGSSTPIAAPPTNLDVPLSQLAGKEWLGKSSGFPENFENDIRSLYRQMFRCYAHIYYGHWLDPFYHMGAHKELNTCFIHFITVGKLFDLLQDKDIKPMQPLVDIWLSKGLIPAPQAPTPELMSAPA